MQIGDTTNLPKVLKEYPEADAVDDEGNQCSRENG